MPFLQEPIALENLAEYSRDRRFARPWVPVKNEVKGLTSNSKSGPASLLADVEEGIEPTQPIMDWSPRSRTSNPRSRSPAVIPQPVDYG